MSFVIGGLLFNFIDNFLKLLRDILFIEKNNTTKIFTDNSSWTLQNLKLKLDYLMKDYRIDFE